MKKRKERGQVALIPQECVTQNTLAPSSDYTLFRLFAVCALYVIHVMKESELSLRIVWLASHRLGGLAVNSQPGGPACSPKRINICETVFFFLNSSICPGWWNVLLLVQHVSACSQCCQLINAPRRTRDFCLGDPSLVLSRTRPTPDVVAFPFRLPTTHTVMNSSSHGVLWIYLSWAAFLETIVGLISSSLCTQAILENVNIHCIIWSYNSTYLTFFSIYSILCIIYNKLGQALVLGCFFKQLFFQCKTHHSYFYPTGFSSKLGIIFPTNYLFLSRSVHAIWTSNDTGESGSLVRSFFWATMD